MSDSRVGSRVRMHDILGREVVDAEGKTLGRVFDLVATHQGDTLRVTSLLVGTGAVRSRFGWTNQPTGREIQWDQIQSWQPRIRLRTGADRRP